MCGVCVSVQSASMAPAAYIAGAAAVGTAGWHRFRRTVSGDDAPAAGDPGDPGNSDPTAPSAVGSGA